MSNDDPRMKCKTCPKEIKYYCQTCTTSYCETHFLETHNKESPHDFIEIFPYSLPETIFCSKHETYFYDMYCNDCKQLVCKTCRSEGHNNHSIVTLEKAKEAILNSIDPETTQLNINSIVSNNVETNDDLEGMVSEVKTGFESTKGLIEQRSQVLTRLIQRQKKDTVSEVERNEDKKQIILSRQKHSESTISQQLNTFLEKCEQANDAEEEEDQISFVHYAWKALSLNFEEINEKKSLFPNTLPGSNWSFSHSKQLESLTNLQIITPIEIMFTKVHLPKMVILPNKCEFQIELRNAEGSLIYADVDPVFKISCHVKDQVIDDIKVTRNPKTGIYDGQITLGTPGNYELKININGILLPKKVEHLDQDIDIIEKSEIDGFEDEFNIKDDEDEDDDDDDFNKINELLQKTERLGLSGNLGETKGFDLNFIAKAPYKLSNCVIKPPNVLICGEGESFSIKLKNKSDKTINPGYDVNFNVIIDCPNGEQDKVEMIKSETSKGLYVGNLKYNSRGLYEMNVKLDSVIFQDSPYIFWVAHHEDKFQLPKNLPMLGTKSKKKITQKINRKQLAETIFFNDKLTVINPGLFENNTITVLGSTRLSVGKKYHYKFRIDKLGSKIRSSSHLEIGIGQYIENGELQTGGGRNKKLKRKKSQKKKKETKKKKDKWEKKAESEESEEEKQEEEKKEPKKNKRRKKEPQKKKDKLEKKAESEESEEEKSVEKEKKGPKKNKKKKEEPKKKKDKWEKKAESEESEEEKQEEEKKGPKKNKRRKKEPKKKKDKLEKKAESEESEEEKPAESEESEEEKQEEEKKGPKKNKRRKKEPKKKKDKWEKKAESEESEEEKPVEEEKKGPKKNKKRKEEPKKKKDKGRKREESEESEEEKPVEEEKKGPKKNKRRKKEPKKKKDKLEKKAESEESEEEKPVEEEKKGPKKNKKRKKEPKKKKDKLEKKAELEESEEEKPVEEEKKGPKKNKKKKKGPKKEKDKGRKKKDAIQTEELLQIPTRLWLYDCGNATKIHNNKTTKFGSKAKEGDIIEMVVDLNHGTLSFGIDKEAKMSNMEMNCELFPTAFKNITNDAIIVVRLYKNNDTVSFVKSLGSTPLMPTKKDRKLKKSKLK
ncbi:hypothetical protein M0813_06648 [Anaeramoeba flamelloides]|uniref:B box-type domain-containing protein n=1 Tax=Anaeramoeba flamelloides TaxID=1746091 RepID=A0ABQ8XDX3_9EUKA|nr:hypothetical protein M0813_06648 [Anaeramoeba flamelloides]